MATSTRVRSRGRSPGVSASGTRLIGLGLLGFLAGSSVGWLWGLLQRPGTPAPAGAQESTHSPETLHPETRSPEAGTSAAQPLMAELGADVADAAADLDLEPPALNSEPDSESVADDVPATPDPAATVRQAAAKAKARLAASAARPAAREEREPTPGAGPEATDQA